MVLKTTQGWRTRQWRIATRRRLQGDIMAEFIVIIEILFSTPDGIDPLPEHSLDGMCVTLALRRSSGIRCAAARVNPSFVSACFRRRTPPWEVMSPPEKSTVTFRDLQAGKAKLVCVHCVIAFFRVIACNQLHCSS